MDNDAAIMQIKALAGVPGALKVITNEVHPDKRRKADDVHSQEKAGVDRALPSTFVLHSVTRIEGPLADGTMVASTDEGDWCRAKPLALLNRLTEWQRETA